MAAAEFGSSAPADRLQVLLAHEPAALRGQGLERLENLRAGILELQPGHAAVGILDDEGEVDDADRPRLHELLERRRDFALELVSRKRHDHVLDRTDTHLSESLLLSTASAAADGLC